MKRDADTLDPIPSIGTRLANALAMWSVVWGLAVGAAVWLAASSEVDELLDDALLASAAVIATLVPAAPDGTVVADLGNGGGRFAWQVATASGALVARSSRAPLQAWHGTAQPGFSDNDDWRLFGLALGDGGRVLYVAQTRAERQEAQLEVALGAVLAALGVGLLGQVWLRARARAALQPLQALSDRVAAWNLEPTQAGNVLGRVTRRELLPLHEALQTLALRLQTRIANEQAFAAHAAHALRTPLAAIDAQLAVALRQAPPELSERLQRVREAAARLQAVVAALLGLFRSGDEPRRSAFSLQELVQRLPPTPLALKLADGAAAATLHADSDLLVAAMINLLDNAKRHGAHEVLLTPLPGGGLRLSDDGTGVAGARRIAMQRALDDQAYSGDEGLGLGLMLADRVARAHDGRLQLVAVDRGFAVEIKLGNPLPTEPAP